MEKRRGRVNEMGWGRVGKKREVEGKGKEGGRGRRRQEE